MISASDRKNAVMLIDEAVASGVHISVKQHGRPGRTACHSAFNGVGR